MYATSTMEHIWYSAPLTSKSVEAFKCVYFPIPWESPPIETTINAHLDGGQLLDKLFQNVSPCGCHIVESQLMRSAIYKGEKLPGYVFSFFGDSNYSFAIWHQPDASDMTSAPVLVGKVINGSFFEAKGVASKSFREFVTRKMIESRIYHHQFLFEGKNKLNKIDRDYIAHYEDENKYFNENKDLSKVERLYNDFPLRFAAVRDKFQKLLKSEED